MKSAWKYEISLKIWNQFENMRSVWKNEISLKNMKSVWKFKINLKGLPFKVKKRSQPTLEISNFTNAFRHYGTSGGVNVSTMSANSLHRDGMMLESSANAGSSGYTRVFVNGSDGIKAKIAAVSEL